MASKLFLFALCVLRKKEKKSYALFNISNIIKALVLAEYVKNKFTIFREKKSVFLIKTL